MSITISDGSASFGLRIPLDSFSPLLQSFIYRYPTTSEIEGLGQKLAQADFPAEETKQFVRRVCEWGGYPGIGGRILKNNPIEALSQTLRDSLRTLLTEASTAKALTQVNALRGLGSPSFASKHLRFLKPDLCPVLDSILHDALPYPFNPDGYSEFCGDCGLLAGALLERGVRNPVVRPDGRWFAADVEAALYEFATRYEFATGEDAH
jgi:hypothetical protein